MEIIEGDFDDVMDMYYRLSASAKRNFEAEHSLTHPLRQGVRKPAGYGEPDGHRRPRGAAEFQADRYAGRDAQGTDARQCDRVETGEARGRIIDTRPKFHHFLQIRHVDKMEKIPYNKDTGGDEHGTDLQH